MSAQLACHGRLGDDPKEITTSSGRPMAVCSLAVAIEERGTDDPPAPLWLNVIAFGRLATDLLRHHRGDLLSVAGRLQRSRWAGQDGAQRERLQVLADAIVSARAVRPGGGRGRDSERSSAAESGQAVRAQAPAHAELDDDLPF